MVYSYYEVGRMIMEEEQNGEQRAEYGKAILKELSRRLTERLGKGFSVENLKLMRRFYVVYSQDQIGQKKRNTGKTIPSVREIQKKIAETLCKTSGLGYINIIQPLAMFYIK